MHSIDVRVKARLYKFKRHLMMAIKYLFTTGPSDNMYLLKIQSYNICYKYANPHPPPWILLVAPFWFVYIIN